MDLTNAGDKVLGQKLVAVGRSISKVHIVAETAAHRAQMVIIKGKPAFCRIDTAYEPLLR